MADLLYGRRSAQSVEIPAEDLDQTATTDVALADVEIHYALFEIPMAVAEARLPVSLHPSVPALIGTTFWCAKDGPLGPFNLAWVGIACRTGIKPRHYVFSAFCDNPRARGFFRARYGLPCTDAAIKTIETYDRIASRVSIDGEDLLEVRSTEAVALAGAGAMVKYSPPLCAARVDGVPALVQFEAGYGFKRVLRGKPGAVTWESARLGEASVVPGFPVSGAHAVCDVALHPVRFRVDLETPAENGGASKLAATA